MAGRVGAETNLVLQPIGDELRAIIVPEVEAACPESFLAPQPDNPLLHLRNVIATPHCASTAFENSAVGVRHWLRNI